MKTLLKISWRNVWRNKARSIVIMLAVGFGLWGGIFATSIINGLLQQQFNSSIKNQVSHIQIHNPDFIKEKQTEMNIEDANLIEDFIKSNSEVEAYSLRTISSGMLASASMTAGIEIYGVDPELERKTTDLKSLVIQGDYFDATTENQVLIGNSLFKKLKIDIGNRVVATFQNLNGEITTAAFRVCGVYRTANSANDERIIFVKQTELFNLLGQDNTINEIAILLKNSEKVNEFRDELREKFAENSVRSWVEVSPELGFMNEFSGAAMLVLLIIIMFALAFGLLNTMLMTIFERTRELGVLMSVGMSKTRIFLMIMFETSFIVISGSVLGTILGFFSVALASRNGLDFTSMGADTLSEFGMEPIIFPSLEPIFYLNLAILVLITSILASVYPAYKALKLKPAEAVRKD